MIRYSIRGYIDREKNVFNLGCHATMVPIYGLFVHPVREDKGKPAARITLLESKYKYIYCE